MQNTSNGHLSIICTSIVILLETDKSLKDQAAQIIHHISVPGEYFDVVLKLLLNHKKG